MKDLMTRTEADYLRAYEPVSTAQREALVWLGQRMRWEHRLAELRAAAATAEDEALGARRSRAARRASDGVEGAVNEPRVLH